MAYVILVLPSAERELAKLPWREARGLIKKIEALADVPRPRGIQKLKGSTDR